MILRFQDKNKSKTHRTLKFKLLNPLFKLNLLYWVLALVISLRHSVEINVSGAKAMAIGLQTVICQEISAEIDASIAEGLGIGLINAL